MISRDFLNGKSHEEQLALTILHSSNFSQSYTVFASKYYIVLENREGFSSFAQFNFFRKQHWENCMLIIRTYSTTYKSYFKCESRHWSKQFSVRKVRLFNSIPLRFRVRMPLNWNLLFKKCGTTKIFRFFAFIKTIFSKSYRKQDLSCNYR